MSEHDREFIIDLRNLHIDSANIGKELIFCDETKNPVNTSNLDTVNFDTLHINGISSTVKFRNLFRNKLVQYYGLHHFVTNKIHLTDYFINKYELVKIVEHQKTVEYRKEYITACQNLVEPQGSVDFNDFSVKHPENYGPKMINLYKDMVLVSDKFEVKGDSKISGTRAVSFGDHDPITNDTYLYLVYKCGDISETMCDLNTVIRVLYKYKIPIPKWFWDRYGINDKFRYSQVSTLNSVNSIRELVRLPILIE